MIRMLTERFTSWRRERGSIRALSRLSDRELSDVGIGRDDIVDTVRQGALLQNAR